MKFCAADLSSYEAICESANFVDLLQSFISMGKNLGNIELKPIFPKSNAVRQEIVNLKYEKQSEIYSKFKILQKRMVFCIVTGTKYSLWCFGKDIACYENSIPWKWFFRLNFHRKDCIPDIITNILDEAFDVSPKSETISFLSTCSSSYCAAYFGFREV